MHRRLPCLLLVLVLASCSSLNYSETSPDYKSYSPKAIALLPVKMPDGADGQAEKVERVIADAIRKREMFASVSDTATVRTAVLGSPESQADLLAYMNKIRTLSVFDRDLPRKVCPPLKADTLIVAEVTKWGYAKIADEKFGETGLSIKMIDCATGTPIWKAAHANKSTYSLFKPDLYGLVQDLTEEIFGKMPQK